MANRIDFNGKTTATDKNNYKKIGNFCREMEQKYNLTQTPNMKCLSYKLDKSHKITKEFSKSDIAESIKQNIKKHLPSSKTFTELAKNLAGEKIKMYQGRGLAFYDKTSKAKFKGSNLGKEFSLQNLEKKLGQTSKIEHLRDISSEQNRGYKMSR